MNNAGPKFPSNTREVAAMPKKPVNQRSFVVTRRRVAHHPGGFVNDDQRRVLINNAEIDLLRFQEIGAGSRDAKGDAITGLQSVTGFYTALVDLNVSSSDELLRPGSREPLAAGSKVLVKTILLARGVDTK